jgi:pilus assembly protein CpaB
MRAVEAAKVELLPVVAAASTIPAGAKVEAIHLKVVGIPSEAIPAAAYTDQKELIGQVAKQTVFAGEIIVAERFANAPGTSALSAMIPEGKRAITVAVNQVVGVSGFILPGSRVDIIATEGGEPKTLLQNIKVLAVGQLLNQEKNDPVSVSAVTLEVDPRQAEIIVKAGGLRLTLRNPEDGLVVAEADLEQAPPSPKPEDAPAVQQATQDSALYVVDIVRGTQVSSTTLDW